MRIGGLLAVLLVIAFGAFALLQSPAPPELDPTPRPTVPSDLEERLDALRRENEELRAAVERLRADLDAARAATAEAGVRAAEAEARAGQVAVERAAELERLQVADLQDIVTKKGDELDDLAKTVSSAIRKGMTEEFGRIARLVLDPTPEELEARRRQLRMFARMWGNNAGLEAGEVDTLGRILEDTDRDARDRLRPLLVGVEDPKQIDYDGLKDVTKTAFDEQDAKFTSEFPAEKADRLKRQVEPVRNIFNAMLDEMAKAGGAGKADEGQ